LSLVEDVIWTSSKRWNSQPMESSRGLGDLQGVNEFFCLQRRGFRDLMKVASRAERERESLLAQTLNNFIQIKAKPLGDRKKNC